MTLPLSILDLAPVGSGSTASQALKNSVELARLGERLGYGRQWFAEHHGMPSIASSTPAIVIAHVAAHTETIRLGAGGVMLPNHVPLKVAEAFHTLEALHPGRIDLGIGRAPGTDQTTSRALRGFDPSQFANQFDELRRLSRGDFPPGHPLANVQVIPSDVSLPPIWLLGSSGASAHFAGTQGVGYSFASHFSHTPAGPALRAYREAFEPSECFPEPHVIVAVSVVCADTDEEADYLASSLDLAWVRISSGKFLALPSPEEATAYAYTPHERAIVQKYRELQIVGAPETVRARLEAVVEETGADELMISTMLHGEDARRRSYELVAGLGI